MTRKNEQAWSLHTSCQVINDRNIRIKLTKTLSWSLRTGTIKMSKWMIGFVKKYTSLVSQCVCIRRSWYAPKCFLIYGRSNYILPVYRCLMGESVQVIRKNNETGRQGNESLHHKKKLIKGKWTIHITQSLCWKNYCFKSLCVAAMDYFSNKKSITLLTPPTCLLTDWYSMACKHSSSVCSSFLHETMGCLSYWEKLLLMDYLKNTGMLSKCSQKLSMLKPLRGTNNNQSKS